MRTLAVLSRLLCLTVVLAGLLPSSRADAQGQAPYPILLTSPRQLHDIGLGVEVHHDERETYAPAFPNRCYNYGRGHTVFLMSFSDAFFERWRKQGFSKESLCLALVSLARFDPETGKRLPTFVLRDDEGLAEVMKLPELAGRKLSQAELDEVRETFGLVTDELPLAVPPCFRNGTPYLDCNWRFGLTTGVPVRPQTAARWREFGTAWDRRITAALKRGKVATRAPEGKAPELVAAGYLDIAGYWAMQPIYEGEPEGDQLTEAMWREWSQLTWTVVSPNLPRGYGYALNATGDRGPAISIAALRAISGTPPPAQISIELLRRAASD